MPVLSPAADELALVGQGVRPVDGVAGLDPPQRGVEAVARHQLVVGAGLGHAAGLEHPDAVGVAHQEARVK